MITPQCFIVETLYIFGRSFAITHVNSIRKHLTSVDLVLNEYNPGEIFDIHGDYYILNDAHNLEFMRDRMDVDDCGSYSFDIGYSVTKNIRDFRRTFASHLQRWDQPYTIGTIAIRHDDAFIVREFGAAFDPSIEIKFTNYEDAWLEFTKVNEDTETLVLLHCVCTIANNHIQDIHIDPGIDTTVNDTYLYTLISHILCADADVDVDLNISNRVTNIKKMYPKIQYYRYRVIDES